MENHFGRSLKATLFFPIDSLAVLFIFIRTALLPRGRTGPSFFPIFFFFIKKCTCYIESRRARALVMLVTFNFPPLNADRFHNSTVVPLWPALLAKLNVFFFPSPVCPMPIIVTIKLKTHWQWLMFVSFFPLIAAFQRSFTLMLEAVDHVNGSRSGKNVLFCFPQLEMAKWKWLLLCASTSIAFNGRGWITLLHHVGRKKKRAEPFADADDAQMPPWRMPVAVVLGEKKAPRAAQLTHERPYQISRGRKRVGWCWLVFF